LIVARYGVVAAPAEAGIAGKASLCRCAGLEVHTTKHGGGAVNGLLDDVFARLPARERFEGSLHRGDAKVAQVVEIHLLEDQIDGGYGNIGHQSTVFDVHTRRMPHAETREAWLGGHSLRF
jgi:hypothetical protein